MKKFLLSQKLQSAFGSEILRKAIDRNTFTEGVLRLHYDVKGLFLYSLLALRPDPFSVSYSLQREILHLPRGLFSEITVGYLPHELFKLDKEVVERVVREFLKCVIRVNMDVSMDGLSHRKEINLT